MCRLNKDCIGIMVGVRTETKVFSSERELDSRDTQRCSQCNGLAVYV